MTVTTTTNIKHIRNKGVCDCKVCQAKATNTRNNVRKKFKRITNKRIRKMDFDSPSYIHGTILS